MTAFWLRLLSRYVLVQRIPCPVVPLNSVLHLPYETGCGKFYIWDSYGIANISASSLKSWAPLVPRLQNESELYQLVIPKNWKLLSIESMLEAIEVEASAFECWIDTATSNWVDSSRILNIFTSSYSFPSQVSSMLIDFATGRIDTANFVGKAITKGKTPVLVCSPK